MISTAGVANRLFFVLVGELTAFQEIAGMVDDHLTYIEASHFGIEAYFSGAGRNEFSVRATKYCTLEALTYEDIDELAEPSASPPARRTRESATWAGSTQPPDGCL